MIKLSDLLNEIKFDSNGQMKIKKQYNNVSDFEKNAKNGDYVWVGKNANDFKNIGQSYLSKVVGKDAEGNAILTPWKRNKKYTIPQKDQLVIVVESINEANDLKVYHKSYTEAIQTAKEYALKRGYMVDDDDSFRKIGMGPRKPSEGKTNKVSVELTKGGKPSNKQLHIQVLKEESFTATNKKTGNTSVFKSKESRDTAIKAGTHADTKNKSQSVSKSNVNTQNTVVKKDNGGDSTKNNNVSSTTLARKGDPDVNKEVRKLAQKMGISSNKMDKNEYQKKMAQAAYAALTDSNFHSEARELVAALEGKPELAKKPDYPSRTDTNYKEKMAAIDAKYNSVYSSPDSDAEELGIAASQAAEYSGDTAIDAIAFELRMNGFHKLADKIQSVIK
jgi:hypothetical protein